MPTAFTSLTSSFLRAPGGLAVKYFSAIALQYLPVFTAAHPTPAAAAADSHVPAIYNALRLLFPRFLPRKFAPLAAFPDLPAIQFGSKSAFRLG